MLDDKTLVAFISQEGINASLVYPGVPTPTVPEAARALGVAGEQIIKSLVFLADAVPLLVIAAGESRIDYKALAEALELSRRKIKFASSDLALDITGFEVGAMPPFGHKEKLPTLLDDHSLRHEELFAGGGTKSALLRISLKELERVTNARRLGLTERTVS
ncbi:MAG: YbaK/EbsC family protein [Trueperaceae bacterium]|nr:YbaK/EbsC family protein [Trueperaceae bacterium]